MKINKKNNNLIKIFLIIILILFSSPKLFGAGTIVNDPITYGAVLEQIVKTKELIEEAQKSLAEMKKATQFIGELRNNISTAYNNTFAIVGETKDLIDTIKETPKFLKKAEQKLLFLLNCLGTDVDQYSKLETLYTAKYVTSTPKDHYANFGTEPTAKYNFGAPIAVQMAERSCGYTRTFQDITNEKIAVHKKAFNVINKASPIVYKSLLKADELKTYEKKLEGISKLLNDSGTNDNAPTLLAKIKATLGVMYENQVEIKNILASVSEIYLNASSPSAYELKISDEQQENINNLTDEELNQGIHTEDLFDKVLNLGE